MFKRLAAVILLASSLAYAQDKPIRAGIIGLDTSHVIAFTKLFNDPKSEGDIAAVKIVAGFPGGSPDIANSRERVGQYTEQLKGMGVEIVDSIPALLTKVDVVLLESVDGRPHLEQARPVLAARKPLFIDKPLAATLTDAIAIAELAKKYNTAWFSCSSLRFSTDIVGPAKDPKLGQVTGCDAWSPCSLEPTHQDLFWYGVHGVEILFTIMGPGCESVTRVQTEGTELAVGTWKDGRIGTFRGLRPPSRHDYGAIIFGSKGVAMGAKYGGYKPLCDEIAKFFKTGKAPVTAEETIQIMAFMQAAEESKKAGGVPVKIEAVMAKAQAEAKAKIGQ